MDVNGHKSMGVAWVGILPRQGVWGSAPQKLSIFLFCFCFV